MTLKLFQQILANSSIFRLWVLVHDIAVIVCLSFTPILVDADDKLRETKTSSENGHFLLPVRTCGTNHHNNFVPFQILLLLRNTSKLTFSIVFLTNFSLFSLVVLTFVLRGGLFYCISAHYKFFMMMMMMMMMRKLSTLRYRLISSVSPVFSPNSSLVFIDFTLLQWVGGPPYQFLSYPWSLHSNHLG